MLLLARAFARSSAEMGREFRFEYEGGSITESDFRAAGFAVEEVASSSSSSGVAGTSEKSSEAVVEGSSKVVGLKYVEPLAIPFVPVPEGCRPYNLPVCFLGVYVLFVWFVLFIVYFVIYLLIICFIY